MAIGTRVMLSPKVDALNQIETDDVSPRWRRTAPARFGTDRDRWIQLHPEALDLSRPASSHWGQLHRLPPVSNQTGSLWCSICAKPS